MTRVRLGTVLSVRDPVLAELAGEALDVAWIDLEHGGLGPADVAPLAIALAAARCEAHVRVPSARAEGLAPVLDAGVDGIVVPGVESADEAEALVRRLRYPPRGERGYGPRRAGRYGRVPGSWSAPSPFCTVQVESPAGVAAAEAIAAVDGVDAVVVGCGDLSLALGAPGDLEHPPLLDAVRRVGAAARAAARGFGVAAAGAPAAVAALLPAWTDLLITSADVRLYAAGVDEALGVLRHALAGGEGARARA